MTTLSEKVNLGDWLKWMVDRRFCLVEDVITAVGGAVVGIVSGQTMQGAAGAKAVNSGGPCTAVLAEDVTLAEHIAGCSKLMLMRGPAIIDSDMMVVDDPSDLTDLEALNIFAINSGLITWTIQTT